MIFSSLIHSAYKFIRMIMITMMIIIIISSSSSFYSLSNSSTNISGYYLLIHDPKSALLVIILLLVLRDMGQIFGAKNGWEMMSLMIVAISRKDPSWRELISIKYMFIDYIFAPTPFILFLSSLRHHKPIVVVETKWCRNRTGAWMRWLWLWLWFSWEKELSVGKPQMPNRLELTYRVIANCIPQVVGT